jgi:DNA gyrase subunit B
MPQVIESGYLYIGQPPLYRVKKGKVERYLKNDASLEDFLIELGVEGVVVKPKGSDKPLSGKALAKLTKQLIRYAAILELLRARRDPRIVDAVVATGALSEKALAGPPKQLDAALDAVAAHISKRSPDLADFQIDISDDEEHEAKRVTYRTVLSGFTRETAIDTDFLTSPECQELATLALEFERAGKAPFAIGHNGSSREAETLHEVKEYVLAEGRRGHDIQRYKGLGEMNPSQLWETTLDPERRTLLQVRIDDAVEADSIFSVLMGDQVEPRREFIEQNALYVRNLDV